MSLYTSVITNYIIPTLGSIGLAMVIITLIIALIKERW